MDGHDVIELRDVTFGYETSRVVFDVPSLSIGPGVTLVLGANGSGKSTLLRLIAGVEPPRTGTVRIGAHDLWVEEVAARRMLAYVPESPELTPYITLFETMQLIAALRRAPDASIASALDRVGLFEHAGRTIRQLSMGQRRRAMLATALIGDPQIIILDEPLETLDAEMRAQIPKLVGEIRDRNGTVLVATHDVAPFVAMADHVVFVRRSGVSHHDIEGTASMDERLTLLRTGGTS